MKKKSSRTILGDFVPTNKERVDLFLAQVRTHRDKLFAQLVEECRQDPQFLDKVLKALKPLRKRGRSKTRGADAVVDSIIAVLHGERRKYIVEAIALTLKLSEAQCNRFYSAALKRRRITRID